MEMPWLWENAFPENLRPSSSISLRPENSACRPKLSSARSTTDSCFSRLYSSLGAIKVKFRLPSS